MTFQKVSKLKEWVVGNIESDTGSEYLFGYEPDSGLKWLERSGVEYSPEDAVWRQAESYVKQSLVPSPPVETEVVYSSENNNNGSPKKVSRSVTMMGSEGTMVNEADPRIVGDLDPGIIDADDEDIAQEAQNFLLQFGEFEE